MSIGFNRTDFITGLILFFVAVGYGFEAWRLPRVHLQDVIDSHVYPLVLAGAFGLLSLGLILKSFWSKEEGMKGWLPPKKVVKQILFLFLGLSAYIFFFQKLGYITSTLLFMMGILKFLDRTRPLWHILLLSLFVAGACYGLFVLLFNIQVPSGIFI